MVALDRISLTVPTGGFVALVGAIERLELVAVLEAVVEVVCRVAGGRALGLVVEQPRQFELLAIRILELVQQQHGWRVFQQFDDELVRRNVRLGSAQDRKSVV